MANEQINGFLIRHGLCELQESFGEFDLDCFFALTYDYIGGIVPNKFFAVKLSMALEAHRKSNSSPEQSSVPPTMQTRWFPQTAAEIAAIRDVELQIVLGCVKTIEDYAVTPNDENLITHSVMKEILCRNGFGVM
jgi:hypothetical protein